MMRNLIFWISEALTLKSKHINHKEAQETWNLLTGISKFQPMFLIEQEF